MLQKSFSEGIYLERVGPFDSTSLRTTCHVNKERSYRTSVYLAPKLIPKRSYLTVDGSSEVMEVRSSKTAATYNRACSLSNGSVKSYESSVSIDQEKNTRQQMNGDETLDGVKCLQNIELVPGLVMKEFSETVNVFATTVDTSYRSNVIHDDYDVKRNYLVGLEIKNFREVTLLSASEESSFTSSLQITPEPCDDIKMNGEYDDML